MSKPEAGALAPAIEAVDQDGLPFSLASLKGKKVALYFYPKDDTPTCTNQACNLRDNISLLQEKGIEVIGVSADDSASHKHFETKFNLPFRLLADTDHRIVNDYGVWGEKSMYGRKYMGIVRTTFLINEAGVIDHVIQKIEAKNHTRQILKIWGLK